MTGPRLSTVRIAAGRVDAGADLIAAVCGTGVESVDGRLQVSVGDARIIIEPVGDDGRTGVVGVELTGSAAPAVTTTLANVDITVNTNSDAGLSPAAAGAATSTVTAAAGDRVDQGSPADVVLDHVAVVVNDLAASAAAWEEATGLPVELIGAHPISNGTLDAARIAVGERMLELLAPMPGTSSAVASRLAARGEGPLALALPANDLDHKRDALAQQGIRLVDQPPHWFVHPANPTGVLIQLTPRVAHH